jgi:hypothetical protein
LTPPVLFQEPESDAAGPGRRVRRAEPGSVQRTSPRAQGLGLREVLPMQAIRHGTMLLLFNGMRSAPRNQTRSAAQYLARGLPCERFTAALPGRTSCITRGRGGWLDLPRGDFHLLFFASFPGTLRCQSLQFKRSLWQVQLGPHSGRVGAPRRTRLRAISEIRQTFALGSSLVSRFRARSGIFELSRKWGWLFHSSAA